MPSGAKKRKAAKKKKENKPSTSKTSVGDENLKHRESEGDHNSEQHLSEGEEEEVVEKREEGISHVEGEKSVSGVENESGVEKRLADEEGEVQIQRESEPDDKFDNRGGSSSGSSSSISDDESPAVEKDIMVVENAPVVQAVDSLSEGLIQVSHTTQVSKIDNSVTEAACDVHVEKVSVLDQHVPEDSSLSADNSLISDAVKSELKENGERKLSENSSASADNSSISDDVKLELKENGEGKSSEDSSASADNSLISDAVKSELKENGERKSSEDSSASADNALISDAVKSELKENGERKSSEDSSESADNALISDAINTELKENVERKSSSLEESSRIEVVNDMAAENKKDEVSNAAASSDAAHVSEDKLMQAYSDPRDDVTKDGEHVNGSKVLASSTGQPSPRPLQTTSWKGCCGLFEVFTGSSI